MMRFGRSLADRRVGGFGLCAALLLANGSMSSNTNNEGEIRKRLVNLGFAVHHERAVLRDRFVQRCTGDQQRPRGLGAGGEHHAVGVFVLGQQCHALQGHVDRIGIAAHQQPAARGRADADFATPAKLPRSLTGRRPGQLIERPGAGNKPANGNSRVAGSGSAGLLPRSRLVRARSGAVTRQDVLPSRLLTRSSDCAKAAATTYFAPSSELEFRL